MNRENETCSDLIDLGAATVETRGPGGIYFDEVLTQRATGLTDD
jgi:hypothetical protein